MNASRFRIACALAAWVSAAALTAAAQNYDLSWFTIAGGGGTSTGAVYSVTGTIGQPAAGHLSGANYALDGGFWGLIAAVQTPGSPLLTLTRSNLVVRLSWSASFNNFVLQQNTNVNTPAGWTTNGVTNIVTANGTNTVSFTLPSLSGNRYFRLKQ